MDRSELFEVLQKLDSLSTFSELLPPDFKSRFLGDLSELKKKINEAGTDIVKTKSERQTVPDSNIAEKEAEATGNLQPLQGTKGSISSPLKLSAPPPLHAPPPPPVMKPPPLFTGKVPLNANKNPELETAPATELAPEKSTFVYVLESLIPKLTQEGKIIIGDLSFSLEFYKILKMIDDKTSIRDLFIMYGENYKNFLEFIALFAQLESEGYLYFVKTREHLENHGWMKLGEIFSEGKVTSAENLKKAFNYQKTKKGIFIGEALVELKLIPESTLRDALKYQVWISQLSENSIFQRMDSITASPPGIQKMDLINTIPPGNMKINTISTTQPGTQKIDSLTTSQPGLFKLNIGPQNARVTPQDKKFFSNILEFIIPVLNDKGLAVLNDPAHKELSERIKIIDGKSSFLSIFEANKLTFKDNKLAFLKFIFKLETQGLLFYRKNNLVQERDVWVKYGELLISLGLISETQLQIALSFKLSNERMRNLFLGETLAELNLIDRETLEDCLKIHKWFNEILAKICYENTFVDAIESVLQDTFHSKVDIGSVKKIAFKTPLEGMICIVFPISGKLNGNVYYILDRSFMNNLSRTLSSSNGKGSGDLDSSIITEISNMITESSLTRLSNIGITCETAKPQIIMDQEIIIADKKPISVIPLMSQMGRFAVGLEISE